MTQGPNVKKLIIHRMSMLAIPAGSPNSGLVDGIKFLSDPDAIKGAAREATAWVEDAIRLVKSSPGNPYGDDEAIAGEILHQIEARKQIRRPGG